MSNKHPIKLGDVFHESWGYDQTNADFYQVVKVMPSSVRIRKIEAKRVGEGHSTRLVPNKNAFVDDGWERGGKGIRSTSGALKRVQSTTWNPNETRYYLNMTSYSNAYLIKDDESFFDTLAAGYEGH